MPLLFLLSSVCDFLNFRALYFINIMLFYNLSSTFLLFLYFCSFTTGNILIFLYVLQYVTSVYIYLVQYCRNMLTKSQITCNIYSVGWVYFICEADSYFICAICRQMYFHTVPYILAYPCIYIHTAPPLPHAYPHTPYCISYYVIQNFVSYIEHIIYQTLFTIQNIQYIEYCSLYRI